MPQGSRTTTTAEAYLLASVGGCIDAIGIMTLGGLYVSHMSGNTAALGAFFGQGNWGLGWPHLFAVPVFLLGLFLGYLCIADAPSYRRCALIFLAEAGLLTAFGIGLALAGRQEINTTGYFLLAAPPLLAMGLQNATLRQIGRSIFPSTYVTGVLDTLAKTAAVYWKERHQPGGRAKQKDILSAAGIWLCYVLGAMGGAAGLLLVHIGILIFPVGVLLSLAWWFFRAEPPATTRPQSARGT